jgi:type VII secretion-associated serine protease mycosin
VGTGTTGLGRAVAFVAALGALGAGVLLPAAPAAAEDVQALQWHLAALDIAAAQKITTGEGVIVGVLDTGVQADHPDLAGQLLPGTDLTPDNRTRGQVDVTNHGTAVAGIIAARGGAGHALGIAPGVKILPVKVRLGVPPDNVAEAIHWAVDHGAKVLNISNGVTYITPEQTEAVTYALAHDVVVVASVGNTTEGQTAVVSPAAIPGVIAVAGTDRSGNAWSGSVHGPETVLAAPAADIETLSNHFASGRPGGYIKVSGTSVAAPIVAGAAALIRAKYPQLHVADVINRLIVTADDLGPAGRDPVYGYGRLNVVKALTADVPPVTRNPLLAPSPSAAPAAAGHGSGPGTGVVLVIAAAAVVLVVLVVIVVLLATRRGRASR